jgi:putative restriction endonuclease
MPALNKSQLLERVLSAIASADWQIQTENLKQHPLEVLISKDEITQKLIIYIWNITHGGATRSTEEYRIQVTGVASPLKVSNEFKTLLLGWYEQEGVFAAFDASKHIEFGFSPSIQVNVGKLREAKAHGLAIQEKKDARGSEIVVTFSPEYIMQYIDSAYPSYHTSAITQITQDEKLFLLHNPLDTTVTRADLDRLPADRKKALTTINRNVRERKFQIYINKIYKGKCAICGLQANLTEAAHIIAVSKKGTDEAGNGILLCRNHHKAYDSGLIAITPDYKIIIVTDYLKQLKEAGLAEDIDKFFTESRIGDKIHLPDRKEDYPNKDYLAKNCSSKGL